MTAAGIPPTAKNGAMLPSQPCIPILSMLPRPGKGPWPALAYRCLSAYCAIAQGCAHGQVRRISVSRQNQDTCISDLIHGRLPEHPHPMPHSRPNLFPDVLHKPWQPLWVYLVICNIDLTESWSSPWNRCTDAWNQDFPQWRSIPR